MSGSYISPEYTHCIRDARFRYNVYEPEADTFLFLEALDKDTNLLRELSPSRCIEIGCGSGTVITHLRCLLMPPSSANSEGTGEGKLGEFHGTASPSTAVGGPLFCAVDINPLALEATGVTWTSTLLQHFTFPTLADHFNNVFKAEVPASLAAPVVVGTASSAQSEKVEANDVCSTMSPTPPPCETTVATTVVSASDGLPDASPSTYCLRRFQGDLFGPVHDALGTKGAVFDVILFNPPYVPTSLEELQDAVSKKDVITAAWCGGPRGRVVTDRFLRQLPSVMSRHGACYVVLIKENDVQDVIDFAQHAFRAYLAEADVGLAEGDVLEVVEVAARYTGEHLSVYRLRYLPPYRDVDPLLA
ncbi:putative eRF1 methyltransferase catalytic subunit [Leptomonas seymouri]|uniref:Putative eRF1 methyltransferase catalytic subunit n=1 Tax=Leptomonas seymouri TaxID=5684 RepID=A0A0N0P6A8_LEPSE|nr:putative eRF1 methyltransferase catalytic subunit [Leptomonas seymouri]|eukprot:KPI87409.1 putative eRF1 methyltransferase catalytic subunit [Leptomonas seymouri]